MSRLSRNNQGFGALGYTYPGLDEDEDIRALQLAYQAVVTASSSQQADRTNPVPSPVSGEYSQQHKVNQQEPLFNAYQSAVSAFAESVLLHHPALSVLSQPNVQKNEQRKVKDTQFSSVPSRLSSQKKTQLPAKARFQAIHNETAHHNSIDDQAVSENKENSIKQLIKTVIETIQQEQSAQDKTPQANTSQTLTEVNKLDEFVSRLDELNAKIEDSVYQQTIDRDAQLGQLASTLETMNKQLNAKIEASTQQQKEAQKTQLGQLASTLETMNKQLNAKIETSTRQERNERESQLQQLLITLEKLNTKVEENAYHQTIERDAHLRHLAEGLENVSKRLDNQKSAFWAENKMRTRIPSVAKKIRVKETPIAGTAVSETASSEVEQPEQLKSQWKLFAEEFKSVLPHATPPINQNDANTQTTSTENNELLFHFGEAVLQHEESVQNASPQEDDSEAAFSSVRQNPIYQSVQASKSCQALTLATQAVFPVIPMLNEEKQVDSKPTVPQATPLKEGDQNPTDCLKTETTSGEDFSLQAFNENRTPSQQQDDTTEEALDDLQFSTENGLTAVQNEKESLFVSILSHPKIAAILIGMCIFTFSVYGLVGYCTLNTKSIPLVDSLLSVAGLNKTENDLLSKDAGTEGTAMLASETSGSNSSSNLIETSNITTGRPDPFVPLVYEGDDPEEKKVKDPLEGFLYTGFVGNGKAKGQVAIMQTTDETGQQQTLVKKIGETFLFNGNSIQLKQVSKNDILVSINGYARRVPVSVDSDSALSSTGGSTTTSVASTGGAKTPLQRLQNETNPELEEY